jgi:hypothetical protein
MDWQATVGDEVSIASHRLGGSRKKGVIREISGAPGHEYYLVEWEDGRTSILHPGPDATLIPKGKRRPKKAPRSPVASPRAAPKAAPEKPKAPPEKRSRQAVRVEAGDRLIIKGHHLGERDRDAEILEVLGDGDARRFRVRWSDTGREGLLFPGTDAVIEHFPRRRRRSEPSKT